VSYPQDLEPIRIEIQQHLEDLGSHSGQLVGIFQDSHSLLEKVAPQISVVFMTIGEVEQDLGGCFGFIEGFEDDCPSPKELDIVGCQACRLVERLQGGLQVAQAITEVRALALENHHLRGGITEPFQQNLARTDGLLGVIHTLDGLEHAIESLFVLRIGTQGLIKGRSGLVYLAIAPMTFAYPLP
jgi:hypothetical protein